MACTVVVFGGWATQQGLSGPPFQGTVAAVPQPQQQAQVVRGGWFNKAQRLCSAVLSEDWDTAWELADQFYAGPDF